MNTWLSVFANSIKHVLHVSTNLPQEQESAEPGPKEFRLRKHLEGRGIRNNPIQPWHDYDQYTRSAQEAIVLFGGLESDRPVYVLRYISESDILVGKTSCVVQAIPVELARLWSIAGPDTVETDESGLSLLRDRLKQLNNDCLLLRVCLDVKTNTKLVYYNQELITKEGS